MVGIGFVVAEDLRSHVNRGELIPHGNFIFEIRAPENGPAIRRYWKGFCIVQKRIWSPGEWHAVYISIHAHERHFAKAFGELHIGGKLRKVERRGEPC